MTPAQDILLRASACFKNARKDLLEGAILLHKISTEELYKGEYDTFGAYVENECQIGVSFASKLISVVSTYMVEGGLKKHDLEDVDAEKLYLAIRTKGSLAAKLEKARLLTRGDLKQELASKDGHECDHDCEHITICSRCHARLQ